jgi:hypothetical protein
MYKKDYKMENFSIYNPVNVYFGKDALEDLGATVAQYGNRILLMYGGTSSTKLGYVLRVKTLLDNYNIQVCEYGGVTPNPTVEQVTAAMEIAQKNNVESILALGGGSVIDAAKVAAISIPENLNPWMVMTRKEKPTRALPIIAILTLAATGSEMNCAAVVQNNAAGKKIGFVHPLMYPKHSFLNPEFTLTVPADQTAFGVVDMIAHALEAWFGTQAPRLTNKFTSAIIAEAMHFGPLAIAEPQNYEYRSNLMLAATCALNGITEMCREGGDWGVHSLGHELSLQFNIAHGASLSIAYPAWLKHHKHIRENSIRELGQHLFSISDVDETIHRLELFFKSMGSPTSLPYAGIKNEHKAQILEGLNRNRAGGYVQRLTDEDRKAIVEFMFQK